MNRKVSIFAAVAICLIVASGGCRRSEPKPPDQASQLAASQPARELTLDLGNDVTMKLVLIPAGKFMMGSPNGQKGRDDNEGPQHQVTITKPFYMGIYAVTQEQYQQVVGANPSHFKGPQNPVDMVSHNDAVEFCKRLTQKTGAVVRLPTEAQWEYACRAGTAGRFFFGDDKDEVRLTDYAWNGDHGDSKTHPVGQKKPNDWGLYDIYGNVWQWCSDWYADSYVDAKDTDPVGPGSGRLRVSRGGGWAWSEIVSSSFRVGDDPGSVGTMFGFRVIVGLK
jgi:formylglycine-generating enzyme required for sulfatase activity